MSKHTIDTINFAAQYARERGVNVRFLDGWENRSGTSKGRDITELQAIYWHHTGSDYTSIAYLRDGDPARGLGTLCNIAVERDGTVVVIAAKYTNTQGYGDKEAHEAIRKGPLDREVVPGADDGFSANGWALGIEVIDRGDAWDPHVYSATTIFTAGLVRGAGLSETNPPVGGHSEFTGRKVDPWYDMAQARRDVAANLAGNPIVTEKPAEPLVAPVPAPAPTYTNPYCPTTVDGAWGPATTRALQHALKHKYNAWGIGAPLVIDGLVGKNTYRAIQRVLNQERSAGLLEDGVFGPRTKKALQAHIGTTVDGLFKTASVKALQRSLNYNRF